MYGCLAMKITIFIVIIKTKEMTSLELWIKKQLFFLEIYYKLYYLCQHKTTRIWSLQLDLLEHRYEEHCQGRILKMFSLARIRWKQADRTTAISICAMIKTILYNIQSNMSLYGFTRLCVNSLRTTDRCRSLLLAMQQRVLFVYFVDQLGIHVLASRQSRKRNKKSEINNWNWMSFSSSSDLFHFVAKVLDVNYQKRMSSSQQEFLFYDTIEHDGEIEQVLSNTFFFY